MQVASFLLAAMATTEVLVPTGHSDLIHDAQYDFYGKRVATCSSDRTIKIFDAAPTGEFTQTGELTGCVWCCAVASVACACAA